MGLSAKWKNLILLAFGQICAMSLWFSATAAVPQLTEEWGLSGAGQSWMTMSVQIGFVAGALLSAGLNLADRLSVERLIAIATAVAGGLNLCIVLFASSPGIAIALRFLTGMALAGVYPTGMKLMATWCLEDRGLGIGLLVGALTVGSAFPHLLSALPAMPTWRSMLAMASVFAFLGAVVVKLFVVEGPHAAKAASFSWRHASDGLRDPAVRLANFGYLGHMWELYAMWAWAPMFILASFERAGISSTIGRVASFSMIAVGGISCLLAGMLADRFGRTTITIASLTVSGCCALTAGLAFDHPVVLFLLCLVWGFSVIADSAQFSAAVTELADPRYIGTALTIQTCMGFLLTMFTIRMVPPMVERFGWENAFYPLALGPLFGAVSMWRLRARPEAKRLAGGKK